jgi:uncharacterized protein
VCRLTPELSAVEQAARRFYVDGDPGHDWSHVERVRATCLRYARALGANVEILLPAALLHDVVNPPKNLSESASASKASAECAAEILAGAAYPAGLIPAVQTVIAEHSYSAGREPSSIESAVLQDADRLDALGAIGIMRVVSCGCRVGAVFYDLDDPFARERPLDDHAYMIDHFFTKLLKLPGAFHTDIGRREAEARVAVMREFLAHLKSELETLSGPVEPHER